MGDVHRLMCSWSVVTSWALLEWMLSKCPQWWNTSRDTSGGSGRAFGEHLYLLHKGHKGVDSRLINILEESWELKGTVENYELLYLYGVFFLHTINWSWISPVKVSTHQRLLDLSQWHREAAPRSCSRMPESRCRSDVENVETFGPKRWSEEVLWGIWSRSKMIALFHWHWHKA